MKKKTKSIRILMILMAVAGTLLLIDHFERMDFTRPQQIERSVLRNLSRQFKRRFVIQQMTCSERGGDGYVAEEDYPDYPVYFSYPGYFYRDYFFHNQGMRGNVDTVRVQRVLETYFKNEGETAISSVNVNLQWDASLLAMLDALDRDPTIEELSEIPFFIKIWQPEFTEQSSGRAQFPRLILSIEDPGQMESVMELLRFQFPNWILPDE